MKIILLISILFVTLIAVPATTFSEKPINCHFGDQSTLLDDIFEKDLAVKEFLKKHPDTTRNVSIDETNPPNEELTFTAENQSEKEVLMIKFTQNENGCYRPKSYHYSYDNGIIDVSIQNSLGNFTEIINLIKSDEKKIEDFYPKNCNPIKLDYVVEGDSKPHFCKIDDSNSIVMSLQKHVGGPVEIKIPDKVMDALFYNCIDSDDYFVLINGEEVDFEWNDNNDEGWYSIIVDLPQGYSKMEVIRTFQLNLTQEGFCGSIWNEHERYISPSLQKRIGVNPQTIQCNDGLVLAIKNDDSPACVMPESIPKLLEREWMASYSFNTKSRTSSDAITTMKPNSMEFFFYPEEPDTKKPDTYKMFLLIRLPEWMGGEVNDASAFRAYSAKSLDDACIVKYWPEDGRQRIENPCQGAMYRVVDGAMTFGTIYRSTPMTALPHLDLSIDENGLLYVEPPKWTKTENGVIGYGRELSFDDFRRGSEFLAESFAKYKPDYPSIPLEFAGYDLSEIASEQYRVNVSYMDFPDNSDRIPMSISKTPVGTVHAKTSKSQSEIWQIGDATITVGGDALDKDSKVPEQFRNYEIRFKDDGFYYAINGKNLEFIKKEIVKNYFPEYEYDDLFLVSKNTD